MKTTREAELDQARAMVAEALIERPTTREVALAEHNKVPHGPAHGGRKGSGKVAVGQGGVGPAAGASGMGPLQGPMPGRGGPMTPARTPTAQWLQGGGPGQATLDQRAKWRVQGAAWRAAKKAKAAGGANAADIVDIRVGALKQMNNAQLKDQARALPTPARDALRAEIGGLVGDQFNLAKTEDLRAALIKSAMGPGLPVAQRKVQQGQIDALRAMDANQLLAAARGLPDRAQRDLVRANLKVAGLPGIGVAARAEPEALRQALIANVMRTPGNAPLSPQTSGMGGVVGPGKVGQVGPDTNIVVPREAFSKGFENDAETQGLLTHPISNLAELGGAGPRHLNPVYTATVDGKTVYIKPLSSLHGGAIHEGIPAQADASRELGSAYVMHAMGDLVPGFPKVVLRDVQTPHGRGKAIITSEVVGRLAVKEDSTHIKAAWASKQGQDVGFFDQVTDQRDRHAGNYMVGDGPTGKVIRPIDHGLAMGAKAGAPWNKAGLSAVSGKPLTAQHRAILHNIDTDTFQNELAQYIGTKPAARTRGRVQQMLKTDHYLDAGPAGGMFGGGSAGDMGKDWPVQ